MQSVQTFSTTNDKLFIVRKFPFLSFILVFFLSGILTGFLFHFASFKLNLSLSLLQNILLFLLAFIIYIIVFINSVLLGQYGLQKIIASKERRKILIDNKYSFTAIIPALSDPEKLTKTIHETARIEYPITKKQIVIVTRFDDFLMNRTAEIARQSLPDQNILIYSYYDAPKSRTHALNCGLQLAEKNIIVVFDEGDVPHPALYKMANAYFSTQDIDVLQAVSSQQMIYDGKKKLLAAVDYYLWLLFVLPAAFETKFLLFGENLTIFKKSFLNSMQGWDETQLNPERELLYRMQIQNTKSLIVSDRYLRKFTTRDYSFRCLFTLWQNRLCEIFSIITKEKWLLFDGFIKQFTFFYTALQSLLLLFIFAFIISLFISHNIVLWSIAGSILFLFYFQIVSSIYIQTNKFTLKNGIYAMVYGLVVLLSFLPISFVIVFMILKVFMKDLIGEKTISIKQSTLGYA